MQRQLHVKDSTVRLTPGERKISSVSEHDLLGHRQAEARPVLLRRLEETEDLDVIGDPGSAVLDRNAHPRGVRNGRRELDSPGPSPMASRAFLTRLSSTRWSLLPSASSGTGADRSRAQRDVARARRRVPEPHDVLEEAGTSIVSRSSRCSRAKARMSRIIASRRRTAEPAARRAARPCAAVVPRHAARFSGSSAPAATARTTDCRRRGRSSP